MKPITIRRAAVADLGEILRFQQGVVAAERPYDSTLKDGAIRYYDFEQLLNSERVHFVHELRLEVYPGNAIAVKAYEKAGFVPQMLEMRMPLD